jgi:hypothetical protein
MALSEARLNADVDFLIGDLPDRDGNQPTATIGANVYDVAVTSLARDKRMEVEAMENHYRFSLYVNAAAVDAAGDRPEVGELVTVDGEDLTVIDTTDDPIRQLLRLDLGEEQFRIS